MVFQKEAIFWKYYNCSKFLTKKQYLTLFCSGGSVIYAWNIALGIWPPLLALQANTLSVEFRKTCSQITAFSWLRSQGLFSYTWDFTYLHKEMSQEVGSQDGGGQDWYPRNEMMLSENYSRWRVIVFLDV